MSRTYACLFNWTEETVTHPLAFIQTSKCAVLGLLRSMRKPVLAEFGIRTNSVCPGVTQSPMTKRVFHRIQARGLSTQNVKDVVRMTMGLLIDGSINGKSIYSEASTGWEFEEALDSTMRIWLGEQPTKLLRANAEYVNTVSDVTLPNPSTSIVSCEIRIF